MLTLRSTISDAALISRSIFFQRVVARPPGWLHQNYTWVTSVAEFTERELPFPFLFVHINLGFAGLFELPGLVGHLWVSGCHVSLDVVSPDRPTNESALAIFLKCLPKAAPVEGRTVSIDFWSQSEMGIRRILRRLHVPKWDEIQSNYTRSVRDSLSQIMAWRQMELGVGKLMLWQGLPGSGKCGWEDAPVRMADGSEKKHKDIKVGDLVLGKTGVNKVTSVEDNAQETIYKITSFAGREIFITGEHPLWTPSGWVTAKESLGHYIQVSAAHGNGSLSIQDASLLGYMIGDGCLAGSKYNKTESCTFTGSDPGTVGRVHRIVESKGWNFKRLKSTDRSPQYGISSKIWHDPMGPRPFFRSHGIMPSNAYTKYVPRAVQTAGKEAVAAFLSALIDTDGEIIDRHKNRSFGLLFHSCSKELMCGVQELLARFGISGLVRKRVSHKKTKRQGASYTSWSCRVGSDELWKLIEILDLHNTEKRRCLDQWRNEYHPRFHRVIDDYVETVEDWGVRQTIAIETEDHTYVTNQVLTHNTWALRALASEWRHWCRFSYITDPDRLFGSGTYLLNVLLEDDDSDDAEAETTETTDAPRPTWHLLILEDTGEFLSSDAKTRTGQALSRVLNTVDGLLGQGLHVILVVTTNEELNKLHPAMARPGRCFANIEFKALEPLEAIAWGNAHGITIEPRSYLLADLYNQVAASRLTRLSSKKLGFLP